MSGCHLRAARIVASMVPGGRYVMVDRRQDVRETVIITSDVVTDKTRASGLSQKMNSHNVMALKG